ncbi:MAG: hypothetical protein ABSD61_12340 [Terracidiphilus sp.]|jgi:hypothetical protein
MSLTIDAPYVESKLQQEATKRGLSTADYAVDILVAHLEPQDNQGTTPFFSTATSEQWNKEFDAWVDSHPTRRPLPDSALSRESIYEGRA